MPETINELNTTKEDCIEKFRNATFGEEVRGALIDLANLVYTDVIDAVMAYVKKGDSITDADINQNGELVLTITNNETQTSRTETVGTVVGSDGDDGAGIQSIRLDTTVGSSTYGHLFIQVQGQSEIDVGYIIGPKGDPGETAPEHEWNVDGSFSQSSVNPVQNKVITAKLNEIMTDKLNKTDVDPILSTTRTNPVQNKVITSALNGKLNKSSVDDAFSQSSTNPVQNKTITAKLNEIIAGKIDKVSMSSNHVLTSNGSGGVKDSTKLIGNSNYFHSGSDYLALESAVKQYTYSKSESDNKYVQISQIDDELDDESENPVQNKVVAEKFAEFEENYSAPEAALDLTSTNAVQNKIIAEALNGKVNISDFNSTIFDDIDLVFSNTNGGIYYGGDCPSAPALFIEAESGASEYPLGYAYYLSYVDSLYDSDDNPHWHRIANISNLITRVIPVDNNFYDLSKNPVQSKVVKAALDKKMEYVDESYATPTISDINGYTDPNKIYHFYLSLNNINEMVDLIFIINDDEADWDNEIYPYSCQFMLSQSGKIYYRKTDDQGLFGNVHDYMENYYTKSEIDAMLNSQ